MSKCRNVPIIILLCVKNPVPEWSGFTTRAFGFAELASVRFMCLYSFMFFIVNCLCFFSLRLADDFAEVRRGKNTVKSKTLVQRQLHPVLAGYCILSHGAILIVGIGVTQAQLHRRSDFVGCPQVGPPAVVGGESLPVDP